MTIRFWIIILIITISFVSLFSFPQGTAILQSCNKIYPHTNLVRHTRAKFRNHTMKIENYLDKQNERRLPKVLRLNRKRNTCKRSTFSNYIEHYKKGKLNSAYEKNKTKSPKATTKSLMKILSSNLNLNGFLAPMLKFQQLYVNDSTEPTLAGKMKEYADKTKKKVKSLFNYRTITEPTIKEDIFKIIFETTKSLDDTAQNNVKIYYMPVMIAADKSFVDFHRELDYETYILTAMNMVADYFTDTTLGLEIYISVSKIMYLDQESSNFNDPKAFVTLRKFCDWSNRVRPDPRHPEYYDVAILITRQELAGCKDSSVKIIGATYSASACLSCKACAVVRDTGLLLGVNIAHQLGHILGLPDDDGESEKCASEAYDHPKFYAQYHHIMSPHLEHERLVWSECSRVAITQFFSEGLGSCLEDEPPRSFHRYPNILPGVMYDADMQCDLLYNGSKSCYTNQEEFCQRLFCGFGNGTCFSYDVEPAQGTSCGMDKWCFNSECVHLGLRPAAVNGRWGAWKGWGPCSRTCGGGIQTSRRVCNNPPPSFGGHSCFGPSHKEQMCNVQQCQPLEPSFRAVQCATFNRIPISGSFHKWRPVFRHVLRDRCSLYCVNQDNVTARMEQRVVDGTPCKPGTNDVCVSGICKAVGCDWVLSSGAVEDRCGICGGAGEHCTQISATYNHSSLIVSNQTKSYIFITQIPKWSTKIRIYQTNPTSSCLAISRTSKNNTEIFLIGDPNEKSCGEFLIGQKSGYYTYLQNHRAYIIIKGPIPYDIKVYAIKCTTISPIHYSFMRLYKEPRTLVHYSQPKHLDNQKFDWEYLDWTPCSARCEGGTERCRVRCVSLSYGLVDDHYCANFKRPPDKIRVCNTQHCAISWHVGPWMGDCPKHRTVHCMREARLWYEVDVIVDSKLCEDPLPVTDINEDICDGNQIFDVQKVEHTTKYCFVPVVPNNINYDATMERHNTTTKKNQQTIKVHISTYKTTKCNNSTENILGQYVNMTQLMFEENTIRSSTDKISVTKQKTTSQSCTNTETPTTKTVTINTSTDDIIVKKNTSPKYFGEHTTYKDVLTKSTNSIKTDLSKWKEFIKKYLISTTEAKILGSNDSSISIDDLYLASTMPFSRFDLYNDLTSFNATIMDLTNELKNSELFQTKSPTYNLGEKMSDLINRINNIRKEINEDKLRVNEIKKGKIKPKSKMIKRNIRNPITENLVPHNDKLKYEYNINNYNARNLRTKDKQMLLIEPKILSNDSVYIIIQNRIGNYFINLFEKSHFAILFNNITYRKFNDCYSTNDNIKKFTETLKSILKLRRNNNLKNVVSKKKKYKNMYKKQNDKSKYRNKKYIGNSIRKIFSKKYLHKINIKRQKDLQLKSRFECVNSFKKTNSRIDLTIHSVRNYDHIFVIKEKKDKNLIDFYLILHINNDINMNKLITSNKSKFINANEVIEIEKGTTLPDINIFLSDLINVIIKNRNSGKKHNLYKTKNIIIIKPKNVNNYFVIPNQNYENILTEKVNNTPKNDLNLYETESFPINIKSREKRNSNIRRSKSNRRSYKNAGKRKLTKKEGKIKKPENQITIDLNNSTRVCRFNYVEDKENTIQDKNIYPNLNVVVKIVCGDNIAGCLSDNVYRDVGDELPLLYKIIKP